MKTLVKTKNRKTAKNELTLSTLSGTFLQKGEKFFRIRYDEHGNPHIAEEVATTELSSPRDIIPILFKR